LLQICEVLRADGLVYQDVEDLLAVGHELNPNIKTWDAACFDGHYVTGEWCSSSSSGGGGASNEISLIRTLLKTV
jgi:glutamine phosphoribosylpyrophosphate amidotransferase